MTTNNVTGTSSSSGAYAPDPAAAAPKSGVDKQTFLQLLVAQVKHQNPLNPSDGVQFLTQLAQFSELEQMMDIRSELTGIREQLAAQKTAAANTEESSGATKDV